MHYTQKLTLSLPTVSSALDCTHTILLRIAKEVSQSQADLLQCRLLIFGYWDSLEDKDRRPSTKELPS